MVDVPFFSRSDIQDTLLEIASTKRILIYAGAGVTVDRSGHDWSSLVDRLLEPVLPDKQVRASLVDLGPQRAASVASELFAAVSDGERQDASRHSMARRLHVLLYEQASWSEGDLAPAIAEALMAWQDRQLEQPDEGWSAGVITPNFDDYLAESVQEVIRDFADAGFDDLEKEVPSPRLVSRFSLPQKPLKFSRSIPGRLSLSYLHGSIPHEGRIVLPVLSEADYYDTRGCSRESLESAFTHCSVLIIGASMTDPPLVEALLATKAAAENRGLRRWVILPKQALGLAGNPGADAILRAADKRFTHLGVKALHPEYYLQVAQFMRELRVAATVSQTARKDYLDTRYGSRLKTWWRDWNSYNSQGKLEQRQAVHHALLRQTLSTLRTILEAEYDESFKIELWVRWNPSRYSRDLVLWSSSVGTWPDTLTARRAAISTTSEYFAARAYCEGRATLYYVDAEGIPENAVRWRSYLALPVWYDAYLGPLPVAAISIASMSDEGETRLHERNAYLLRRAAKLLSLLGKAIVDPASGSLADFEEYRDGAYVT